MPSDSDGSANMAIIGIDRSITAWSILMDRCPRDGKSIRPILRRLRGWADRECSPRAGRSCGPGSTTGRPPGDRYGSKC